MKFGMWSAFSLLVMGKSGAHWIRHTYDYCTENAFEGVTLLINRFIALQNSSYVRTKNTFVSVQLTQFFIKPHREIGRHFSRVPADSAKEWKRLKLVFGFRLIDFDSCCMRLWQFVCVCVSASVSQLGMIFLLYCVKILGINFIPFKSLEKQLPSFNLLPFPKIKIILIEKSLSKRILHTRNNSVDFGLYCGLCIG